MTKLRELINLYYKEEISISKFLEEINEHFTSQRTPTMSEMHSSASEKWATTNMICEVCGHYWQAVYPVQVLVILGQESIKYPELECPNCKNKNTIEL